MLIRRFLERILQRRRLEQLPGDVAVQALGRSRDASRPLLTGPARATADNQNRREPHLAATSTKYLDCAICSRMLKFTTIHYRLELTHSMSRVPILKWLIRFIV